MPAYFSIDDDLVLLLPFVSGAGDGVGELRRWNATAALKSSSKPTRMP